jgi:hypothetical protein
MKEGIRPRDPRGSLTSTSDLSEAINSVRLRLLLGELNGYGFLGRPGRPNLLASSVIVLFDDIPLCLIVKNWPYDARHVMAKGCLSTTSAVTRVEHMGEERRQEGRVLVPEITPTTPNPVDIPATQYCATTCAFSLWHRIQNQRSRSNGESDTWHLGIPGHSKKGEAIYRIGKCRQSDSRMAVRWRGLPPVVRERRHLADRLDRVESGVRASA